MRRARMLAFALPMVLAGCVDDRPFPVAGLAVSADLPPLPPTSYGATPSTHPGRSAYRRVAARATLTDDQIRIRILQAAIAACVPGAACTCPDITPAMIADWRRQHGR